MYSFFLMFFQGHARWDGRSWAGSSRPGAKACSWRDPCSRSPPRDYRKLKSPPYRCCYYSGLARRAAASIQELIAGNAIAARRPETHPHSVRVVQRQARLPLAVSLCPCTIGSSVMQVEWVCGGWKGFGGNGGMVVSPPCSRPHNSPRLPEC